jgi:inosine/xanthosine triphosphate pyrophosphatase family protein
MTTAELSPEEKNRISHRGRALEKIKPLIRECLSSRDCSGSL